MEPGSTLEGSDDTVKQLLGQARSAISASDAASALQCVIQALQLIRGDAAVLPTLRNAAEQYHAQRVAPIEEISALLSQVTLQAEQQQVQQYQQQHMQHMPPWRQLSHLATDPAAQQTIHHMQQFQQQQPQLYVHPQQLQQQQHPGLGLSTPQAHTTPILDETGRGDLASIALQEGSYWQCSQCGGLVPVQRQQAHLETWCPAMHGSNSDDMQ